MTNSTERLGRLPAFNRPAASAGRSSPGAAARGLEATLYPKCIYGNGWQ
jgi:hypothetical protein